MADRQEGKSNMDANLGLGQRQMDALVIALLVAASLALTRGFACALPLASFAAIAALMFEAGTAVAAMLAVWLANQIIGFCTMHYPTDASTFAWGGALGGLGLASLFAARSVLARIGGWVAAPAAFLASFAAYEGLLFVINLLVGLHAAVFAFDVVARIFAINAAAFGVMFAAYVLWSRSYVGRKSAVSRARHA
jgi:hypothetical protein